MTTTGVSSYELPADQPPGTPTLEFSVFDLAIAILKRKRAVLLTAGAGAVLFVLISFIVPASYTSTTRLMPPQQNQSIASSVLGQLGPLAGLAGRDLGTRNPSELYVALLQSDTVEDALVQRFNLMSVYKSKLLVDARARLKSRSEIIASKEGIISISVTDHDPKRAAAIANAYVDELYKLNQTLAVTQAAQRRLFFQQQLEQEKNNLSDAEVALKLEEEKSGLIQPESQARAVIEKNARLEAEIATTDVELRSMNAFATPENPQYVSAQQRLDALEAELAKSETNRGKLQLGVAAIPEVGLAYVRKLRDVKYHEALYELLLRQLEMAKLDEAKSASIIQVLDVGLVPERRSSPRRSLYLIMGLGLGIAISLLSVVFGELGARARNSKELGPKVREIEARMRFGRPRMPE